MMIIVEFFKTYSLISH